MSITCQKKYAVTVGDTCQDSFVSSADTASLVSWANPAQFAFRYSVSLVAGQIASFGVKSNQVISSAWFTSGGVGVPDSSLMGDTGTVGTSYVLPRYIWSTFFCVQTGNYVFEVYSPVNLASLNRYSIVITSTSLDVITISSPIAHDGSGNFCAVHNLSLNSGDVISLLSMPQDPTLQFSYVVLYDNAWNALVSTFPESPQFEDGDCELCVIPSTGTYHVENIIDGDVGNAWFARGCGVFADLSFTSAPQTTPITAIGKSKGNFNDQVWVRLCSGYAVIGSGPNLSFNPTFSYNPINVFAFRGGIVALSVHSAVGIGPPTVTVPWGGYPSPSSPCHIASAPVTGTINCPVSFTSCAQVDWTATMLAPPGFSSNLIMTVHLEANVTGTLIKQYCLANWGGGLIMEFDAVTLGDGFTPAGDYVRGNAYGFDNVCAMCPFSSLTITTP